MNRLLPNIDKLVPITENSKTFSDSLLNKDFNLLSFKDKLQILNDIVRQTMIYNENANPLNDTDTLIGDDYTAALIGKKYLEKLNIGKNIRLAFARGTKFDDNFVKVVLLVDDYLFDATPKVGYKAGYVSLSNEVYKEYIAIEGELESIFKRLRSINFILDTNISKQELYTYIEFLNYSLKYDVLESYINKIYNKIKLNYDYDLVFNKENTCDKIKLLKQVKIWSTELKELINGDKDYKRQIELAQNITFLQNIINSKESLVCNLGKKYNMDELTPRVFLETGLSLVMIKPSSYIFNWEYEIKAKFLEGKYDEVGNYFKSLGNETDLGIMPMKIFHPHGYKYIREMTGPTEIFLVERSATDIGKIKKKIRQEYKLKVNNKEVIWFDNEKINWNPICLNFAHSSDDPCEACMGYTSLYPEYQVMTRFMYPNPLIIEEEKNGRIRI